MPVSPRKRVAAAQPPEKRRVGGRGQTPLSVPDWAMGDGSAMDRLTIGAATGKSRILGFLGHPRLGLACRLAIGIIFIYASLDKIAHPAEFAKIIYGYRLLPLVAINAVAILLPWLELVAGGMIVLGLLTRGSALTLTAMLAVFTAALAINLARGLNISCGCFSTGPEGMVVGWRKISENVLLLAIALQVLLRGSPMASLGRRFGPRWR